jgi:hypothetical protein
VPELRCLACHLRPVGDALVAGIGVDDLLIAVQEISSLGEVVNIGSRDYDRMNQARVLVHTCVDFHAVGAAFREAGVPLVAFLGLVHLRIPLPFFVLGGTRRGDEGGIDDRALAHRHAFLTEVGFVGLKDLLAQLVLLKQMAEGQDRRFIWNPVADQLDAGKAAHGGHLDQGLFHGWVAERIPLLQQVNAQQLLRRSLRLRGQRIGRPAAFLARLGVVGLDQSDQRRPRHDRLHLSEKLLALGLLLGGGQLVIGEAELLATHQSSHDLRLQGHCRVDRLGFPESPYVAGVSLIFLGKRRPSGGNQIGSAIFAFAVTAHPIAKGCSLKLGVAIGP